MMKRYIALLLCLCMVLALAGCGNKIEQYEDPEAEATAAPEEAEAAEDDSASDTEPEDEDAEPEPTAEPGLGYAAYEPDEVVATFDGRDITWQEYYYWLSYYEDYVRYLASMGLPFSGWEGTDLDGEHENAEVVRISAKDSMFQYRAMESIAEKMDLTLTDEDRQEIQDTFEQSADAYGDGDGECTEEESAAYEEYLDGQFASRELFDYMGQVVLLSQKAFDELYGEDAADFPEEDALAFADEQDILSAKHILLLTKDMATGEDLTEEEIEEKSALAAELYDELSALAEDPEALEARFDELMSEHSEDTGLATNPDGYLFGPGVMVDEFSDATAALEEYGLSEPVQSDYGYHIILRLPVDPDGTVTTADGSSYTVRMAAANAAFSDLIEQAVQEGEVVWNGDFENVDIAEIFGE